MKVLLRVFATLAMLALAVGCGATSDKEHAQNGSSIPTLPGERNPNDPSRVPHAPQAPTAVPPLPQLEAAPVTLKPDSSNALKSIGIPPLPRKVNAEFSSEIEKNSFTLSFPSITYSVFSFSAAYEKELETITTTEIHFLKTTKEWDDAGNLVYYDPLAWDVFAVPGDPIPKRRLVVQHSETENSKVNKGGIICNYTVALTEASKKKFEIGVFGSKAETEKMQLTGVDSKVQSKLLNYTHGQLVSDIIEQCKHELHSKPDISHIRIRQNDYSESAVSLSLSETAHRDIRLALYSRMLSNNLNAPVLCKIPTDEERAAEAKYPELKGHDSGCSEWFENNYLGALKQDRNTKYHVEKLHKSSVARCVEVQGNTFFGYMPKKPGMGVCTPRSRTGETCQLFRSRKKPDLVTDKPNGDKNEWMRLTYAPTDIACDEHFLINGKKAPLTCVQERTGPDTGYVALGKCLRRATPEQIKGLKQ